ncbi:MAG: DoxX family protein [Pseudomonadota bacterium]
MKYVSFGIRALLTLAFLGAGGSKLFGVDQMVQVFDMLGLGQWFRYVTGGIEIVGAILLWVPGRQVLGAALLGATMVGAVPAHLLILGPSPVPAIALGLLCVTVIYLHREQIPGREA